MRRSLTVGAMIGVLAVMVSGCSGGMDASSPIVAEPSSASATGPAVDGLTTVACRHVVVALDPGHNPVSVNAFDPVTGAAEIDYSNGAEDRNVFEVAQIVKSGLERRGYQVVLVKREITESVTYRDRVRRAEQAHAAVGISIHTSPGVNEVFPQRVGLYREGVGVDGTALRVTFTNAQTATASQRYARAIAAGRSEVSGSPVVVTDNNFAGRAPLWDGNIPIISLISANIPWVYNEFGTASTGGSVALDSSSVRTYADGLIAGVGLALPVTGAGCAR